MTTQKGVPLPDDFADALTKYPDLFAVLEHMRPSCQREYVDWIDEVPEGDRRIERIDSVLIKIIDWGERHELLPQLELTQGA